MPSGARLHEHYANSRSIYVYKKKNKCVSRQDSPYSFPDGKLHLPVCRQEIRHRRIEFGENIVKVSDFKLLLHNTRNAIGERRNKILNRKIYVERRRNRARVLNCKVS